MDTHPLSLFLTQKGWSNAELARQIRPQSASESDAAYQSALLNLTKNIAKWRKKISRPTPRWIAALEKISDGTIAYRCFYGEDAASP